MQANESFIDDVIICRADELSVIMSSTHWFKLSYCGHLYLSANERMKVLI